MNPEIFNLSTYYPHLDEFSHKTILDGIRYPWDVLTKISDYIQGYIEEAAATVPSVSFDQLKVEKRTVGFEELMVTCHALVEIKERSIIAGTKILLEPGVVIEPGAMIKSPAIIGAKTEVRQGAYLRGNVIVGDYCTCGHTTEVKNSIFMNHTEAGHFAYVGDSVLGSYVNLGAGTKLANLQFRNKKAKLRQNFPEITLKLDGEIFHTGTAKIGAFFGDHGEAGCNSVIAPGVFLGFESWVMPNKTLVKGYYPPKTIIR